MCVCIPVEARKGDREKRRRPLDVVLHAVGVSVFPFKPRILEPPHHPITPLPSPSFLCLQGRLPIRVQLKGLSEGDLYKILTEPKNNLIRQQVEIMKTEGVRVSNLFV